jgi:hypothetical protein
MSHRISNVVVAFIFKLFATADAVTKETRPTRALHTANEEILILE